MSVLFFVYALGKRLLFYVLDLIKFCSIQLSKDEVESLSVYSVNVYNVILAGTTFDIICDSS